MFSEGVSVLGTGTECAYVKMTEEQQDTLIIQATVASTIVINLGLKIVPSRLADSNC
jgi:hypothetical protein